MTIPKPNWYVSCSPRDPRKLVPELRLLLKYEGKNWTVTEQENYAKELRSLDSFEGEGYEKELGFTARDRVAKLKTYGFAYVSDANIVCITPAGKRICETKIPEEVFLKQMLKWQFPSYQHNGKEYPSENFFIRPFIFVSKLIEALNGITKRELSIFAFHTTKEENVPKIIAEIKAHRAKRETIKGKTKKLEFDYVVHYQRFKSAFDGFIKQGKTTIRESGKRKFSEKDYLDTKIRSSGDMADAFVRHLRFTPLFTVQGNRVIIADNMGNMVLRINREPIRIYPNYTDVEQFYQYMGDPDIPITVIDEKKGLLQEIGKLLPEVQARYREAQQIDVKLPAPQGVILEKLAPHELKDYLFSLLEINKQYKRVILEVQLQKPEVFKDIIATYKQILEREVIDAPSYFEWNTWRALLHIDDEEKIIPNFPLDKDLKPLNTAGGKKGDIEAHYPEASVLVEVTLSSGERQANTEIEPVWRHVGNFQKLNKGKKTFGLFIAPEINNATYRHFFAYASQPLFDDGTKITIVPLSLKQFTETLNFFNKVVGDKSQHLNRLFLMIENEARSGKHKDGIAWSHSLPEIISQWKTSSEKI